MFDLKNTPLHVRLGLVLLLATLLLTACGAEPSLPYGYYDYYGLADEFEPLLQGLRVAFALGGLALLVAGWKIYRFIVALPGFLIGAALGAGLGYASDENLLLALLGLVIGGLIGAALALFLHDLAIFLIGGLIGAVLVAGLYVGLAESSPPALLLIIAGIIGGAVLLALSHLWIVVLSSIVGAGMFGLALNAGAGWMLLICLAGIGIQYGAAAALGEKLPGPGKKIKQVVPSRRAPPVPPPQAASAQERPLAPAPPKMDIVLPGPPPAAPSPQPAPPPPAAHVPQVAPPPPVAAPLANAILVSPDDEWFRVHDGYLVGRGSACDLRLPDRAVSRRHARLRYAQGTWFLQDEGSTGGTFVNGQRVTATRLSKGDRIQIGGTTLVFYPEGVRD